jgi:hypothetical protein
MVNPDAESLFVVGASHASSARVLDEKGGAEDFNGIYSASAYLLIGYAVELSLKAAFIQLGGTVRQARNDIGHSLKGAFAEAGAKGFTSRVADFPFLIEHFEEPHKTHFFRYMTGREGIEVPYLSAVFGPLEAHLEQVVELLYAEEIERGMYVPRF